MKMYIEKSYDKEYISKGVTIHDRDICKDIYVGDIPSYMLPNVFTKEHSNLLIEEVIRGGK